MGRRRQRGRRSRAQGSHSSLETIHACYSEPCIQTSLLSHSSPLPSPFLSPPPLPCSYYWDSYWGVIGLLHCGMYQTAEGVVLNLVHLLDTFGFVPNGGRVYYSLPGRSQPPLLSHMVRQVYSVTGNASFLAAVYPSLLNEYSWWMKGGQAGHAVTLLDDKPGGTGQTYTLQRYVTEQYLPRPESWLEDVTTAASAGYSETSLQAQRLFANIAAAAESGWDFTGRWFADQMSITSCDTVRARRDTVEGGLEQRIG